MKHYVKLIALLFICTVFMTVEVVNALSSEQRRVIDSGAYYFNTEVSTGGSCSTESGPVSMTASVNIPEPHKSVIERSASKHSVNPNLLAALFLSEQGNVWRPFEGPYASSGAGASGPFQFMPGTWSAYKEDGNGDGVADIQNFEDAAFAAGKLAATGTNQATPLGTLDNPFAEGTLIYFSATYNWGPGNVSSKTNPDSPLSAGPTETQNYMKNIHALISSDFTQSGNPNYGPPRLPGGNGGNSDIQTAASTPNSCSTTAGLATNDASQARDMVLSSENIVWGNYGPASSQKQDVESCLSDTTLISFATMAEKSGVKIPINALATDHGGCVASGGSHHNYGRAIDIGYYASGAAGQDRHVPDGDTLYRFLYDNREILKIDELIWQYPPAGYKCMNDSVVGDCDSQYKPATMNQHYHHIHVSFID